MLRNAAAVRPRIPDDQRDRNRCRFPAEIRDDRRSEANLSVERRQELADIHDCCLQLDDEQRVGRRVPTNEVDHASLAPDGERDLGPNHPRRRAADPRRDRLGQRRMTAVPHPFKVATSRPRQELERDLERTGNAAGHRQGDFVESATFDAADRSTGHPSRDRQVILDPAALDPRCFDRRSHEQVVHPENGLRRRLPRGCRRAGTGRFHYRTNVRYDSASESRC